MKFVAKTFAPVGSTIEATELLSKQKYSGIVRQANPDGALFCQLEGIEHLMIVQAPPPPAPVVVKAPTIEEGIELVAEIERLQKVVEGLNAVIAEKDAQIAKLSAK